MKTAKNRQNTIYMQAALDHLKKSQEIRTEDEARLSPLVIGHINVLGHYSWFRPELKSDCLDRAELDQEELGQVLG